MYNSDRRNSPRQSSQHRQSARREDGYLQEKPKYILPRNGWTYAIIIGLIGGLIALAVPVIITLITASLSNQVVRGGAGLSTDLLLGGSQCFGFFIDLVIAFFVGRVAGKRFVKHWGWQSFLAGVVGGAIFALGLSITHYIPGYPGVITTSTNIWLQIVGGFIILPAIYALMGGLISLAGRSTTKPTHP